MTNVGTRHVAGGQVEVMLDVVDAPIWDTTPATPMILYTCRRTEAVAAVMVPDSQAAEAEVITQNSDYLKI